ncbi:MAG: GIY-YIG nuclease family protein [Clostridiales bacterium]|nr:GIY-YIG nuclease family protein [Clostridiales bacterium]
MSLSDILGAKKIKEDNLRLKNENSNLNKIIEAQKVALNDLQTKLHDLGYEDREKADAYLQTINSQIDDKTRFLNDLKISIENLSDEHEKAENKKIQTEKRISKLYDLYRSVEYAVKTFEYEENLLSDEIRHEIEELSPSVELKLHCMDIKSLLKAYRANDKEISKLQKTYESRYTTKANQTIYQLMVIALRAELQNILYNIKYEKLDASLDLVKDVTRKYLTIASTGNQSIAPTLTKFIGQIEYLFLNAVKIEYNYYVKKEQARQEQLAIKQKMREEAEERKALEAERKRVEQEENKYESEIEKIKKQMATALENEKANLNARILELQAQLSDVIIKKEEITKLQNGRAGNVYIISNLGSFGDNIFKIGMTRRLDPQERIDELGSASVPFKFDVHSFIFSDNAVDLETKLHNLLNSKRVNKVNLRKEFFYSSIEELEELVNEIEPTAEFKKTMIAEEFRQSLSTSENYTSEFIDLDNTEEEED